MRPCGAGLSLHCAQQCVEQKIVGMTKTAKPAGPHDPAGSVGTGVERPRASALDILSGRGPRPRTTPQTEAPRESWQDASRRAFAKVTVEHFQQAAGA